MGLSLLRVSSEELAKQHLLDWATQTATGLDASIEAQGDELLMWHAPPLQVFLSATLANATEFAAWVAGLHKQPCHVVYTDFRPTPLQHYAFPVGGNGLYAVRN